MYVIVGILLIYIVVLEVRMYRSNKNVRGLLSKLEYKMKEMGDRTFDMVGSINSLEESCKSYEEQYKTLYREHEHLNNSMVNYIAEVKIGLKNTNEIVGNFDEMRKDFERFRKKYRW